MYSLGERIACATARQVKITPQNGQPHIISGGLSFVVEGAGKELTWLENVPT